MANILQERKRRRRELEQQKAAAAKQERLKAMGETPEQRAEAGYRPTATTPAPTPTPSPVTVAPPKRQDFASLEDYGRALSEFKETGSFLTPEKKVQADTQAAGITTGGEAPPPPQADNITREEVTKKEEPSDFQSEIDRLTGSLRERERQFEELGLASTVKPEQLEAVQTARKLQEELNKQKDAASESALARGAFGTSLQSTLSSDPLTLGSIFGDALTPEQQTILGSQLSQILGTKTDSVNNANAFAKMFNTLNSMQVARTMDKLDPRRDSGLSEKTERFTTEPYQEQLRQNDISLERSMNNLTYHETMAEAAMNRALSDRERLNAQNDARAQQLAATLGVQLDTNAQTGMMAIHQEGQRAVEDLLSKRAATQKYYADTKVNLQREYNSNYISIKSAESKAVSDAYDKYLGQLQDAERLGLEDMNEFRKEIEGAEREYLGNYMTITNNALNLIADNKAQAEEKAQNALKINKDMSSLRGVYIDGNGKEILDDDGNPIKVPETTAKIVHWSTDNDGILYGVDENGEVQSFGAIGKASKKAGTGGVSSGEIIPNVLDDYINVLSERVRNQTYSLEHAEKLLEAELDNSQIKNRDSVSSASKIKLNNLVFAKGEKKIISGFEFDEEAEGLSKWIPTGFVTEMIPTESPEIIPTETEFKTKKGGGLFSLFGLPVSGETQNLDIDISE